MNVKDESKERREFYRARGKVFFRVMAEEDEPRLPSLPAELPEELDDGLVKLIQLHNRLHHENDSRFREITAELDKILDSQQRALEMNDPPKVRLHAITLSGSGMSFISKTAWVPETRVGLTLAFLSVPFSWLDLKGRIVRHEELAADPGHFKNAVQFIGLTKRQQDSLVAFVNQLQREEVRKLGR